MKKLLLTLPIVALGAGGLQAQQGTKWIGVQGAYITQDGSFQGTDIKDGGGYGLGLGTWLTNRWGLEGSVMRTKLKSDNVSPEVDGNETHLFASGLMNLRPGEYKYYPYLRLGLGMSQVDEPWSGIGDSTTRMQYHGGFGVQGFFGNHFIGNLEGRVVRIATDTARTEFMGILGGGFRWGGQKAVPPPPPPPAAQEEKPAPAAAPPPPPPPPPPVVQEKPVPPPPPPPRIVLDEATLHFANDKAVLDEEAHQAIQQVAERLKSYMGEYTLEVTGYTSSPGSKAHNELLSRRRAEAVAKVLEESGIPATSIQVVGKGPADPVADNATLEGQAQNRRVEIDIKLKNGHNVELKETKTQPVNVNYMKKRMKKKAPKKAMPEAPATGQ